MSLGKRAGRIGARLSMAIIACSACIPAFAVDGPMGVERVARMVSQTYEAKPGTSDDDRRWVQVDLGATRKIDVVKLLPVIGWGTYGYPVRFRIEASDDPSFGTSQMIADCTASDTPDPGDVIGIFRAGDVRGRYVRLTVTKLRDRRFALAKLEVWSGGRNVSTNRPATDSERGVIGVTPLTSPSRPQGEEVVTDNPGNVIPVSKWKPVPYVAHAPLGGVRLDDGVLKTVMQNNIGYLLGSFTVDEMLRGFRERAGKPEPAGMRPAIPFWDTDLPGSSAGRFMMGAGNTLRWMSSPELRHRMNQIVDGIEECRASDGFIMAYPENTIFHSERAAYTRSWVTHGLIEAGYAGNRKAFRLLRGFYDWFDRCPFLPELLRRGGQGVQGMIPNARMYFTPVGKPADLQVLQRYFQENYWLRELAARDPRAIWQYPYDHPHNYLITSLEPYLDQYRATGAKKYLDAAQGGWDLYHNDWEHIGGSMAICEGDSYPPKSNFLHRHTGELCGNVFWIRYNQRFHLLHPDQEKYVAEIEKSIYNVGLPNQVGTKGIRYHANLVGRKDNSTPIATNSCCEGQGTRLYGSLPEYVYSIASDGIYVDLFAGSTITWRQAGKTLRMHMVSHFPFDTRVTLHLSVNQPTRSRIRVRVPAWAASQMPITVNGVRTVIGKPGTYALLDRVWRNGDMVRFTLPAKMRLTRYHGAEEVAGQDRYALEYGPVLMAVVGPMDEQKGATFTDTPGRFLQRLSPKAGEPLHFSISGDPDHEYLPYWQVTDQVFTCFPVISNRTAPVVEHVGAGDLALASKGATATSDSEYAQERGCTAKVIDGIVASAGDFANRWHSSLDTPHPHWVEVKLAKPETIGRVVVRFADPAGHPVRFRGSVNVAGSYRTVFSVDRCDDMRKYETRIQPVVTDTFRLEILESANPTFLNAAQVSEIELYRAAK